MPTAYQIIAQYCLEFCILYSSTKSKTNANHLFRWCRHSKNPRNDIYFFHCNAKMRGTELCISCDTLRMSFAKQMLQNLILMFHAGQICTQNQCELRCSGPPHHFFAGDVIFSKSKKDFDCSVASALHLTLHQSNTLRTNKFTLVIYPSWEEDEVSRADEERSLMFIYRLWKMICRHEHVEVVISNSICLDKAMTFLGCSMLPGEPRSGNWLVHLRCIELW